MSSQYGDVLKESGMTWDNKRGWSIPRHVIDSMPALIGFMCVATLGGKEFQSANYLIHTTGTKKKRYIQRFKGFTLLWCSCQNVEDHTSLNFSSYKNTTDPVQIFK